MSIESIKVVHENDVIWSELLPAMINYNICIQNLSKISITAKGIVFRFNVHVPIYFPKKISLVLDEWTSNK